MVSKEAAKKLTIKSDLIIFFATNKPPIKTKGSIERVPTHQVAKYPVRSEAENKPIAAGLNICFLLMAKIYFEAIAKTDDHNMKEISPEDIAGVMTRTKIKAVIYIDSLFAGTSKNLEKIRFAMKQVMTINNADKIRLRGL